MKNKHLKVFLDGTEFDVEVQAVDARGLEVSVNGRPYKVEFEDLDENGGPPAAVSASAATGPGGPLRAPMPGDVTQVLVKAGDEVGVGQELLVLEAMKMKNVLRAPRAGRVAAVEVAAGQSVTHGDVLVRFEE
jgi:biotin carboxyl carrier protein